jgi:predicted nicotinamide N-methyase
VQLDPLRASLAEQLTRMRAGAAPTAPLLDIVSQTLHGVTIIRARDWDELRHEEAGAGHGVPYWGHLWPSGRALGEHLAAAEVDGLRVLELGCGLGLPSVVAASRGAEVLATDATPEAVVFTAHNLALNDLPGQVAKLDWREGEPLVEHGPWDLVVGADILYLRHNVEALSRLLPRLLDGRGEALIADPRRAGGRDFLAAARGLFAIDPVALPPGHDGVALHRLRRRRHG